MTSLTIVQESLILLYLICLSVVEEILQLAKLHFLSSPLNNNVCHYPERNKELKMFSVIENVHSFSNNWIPCIFQHPSFIYYTVQFNGNLFHMQICFSSSQAISND